MPYCNLQTIIRWNIHLISRLQLFWHLIHLSFNQSVRSHFSQSIVTSYSAQHELCSTCNALHFGKALKIAPSIRCNASIFAFKYRHIISTYQTSTIIKCTDSWQILIVTPNHSWTHILWLALIWSIAQLSTSIRDSKYFAFLPSCYFSLSLSFPLLGRTKNDSSSQYANRFRHAPAQNEYPLKNRYNCYIQCKK